MIVDLDYIKSVKRALRRINIEDIDDLQFILDGETVEFDEDDIKQFKFMGLNNTDILDVLKPIKVLPLKGK
jgi:hypothetical protein